MKILSSVHIIVEDGGTLNLMDSTVQGIIDVQSGGTFSMNYDSFNQTFVTGASVCGQVRMADGSILENTADLLSCLITLPTVILLTVLLQIRL